MDERALVEQLQAVEFKVAGEASGAKVARAELERWRELEPEEEFEFLIESSLGQR
jgi:hypothetical protein